MGSFASWLVLLRHCAVLTLPGSGIVDAAFVHRNTNCVFTGDADATARLLLHYS